VFSRRLPWSSPENALAALARERAARGEIIDLTETNPTAVGLPYPAEALRAALGRGGSERYQPAPFGLASARAAVAAEYARAGVSAHPDRIVLTASSSESYAFLFKLLADPGDAVLVPEPSYPLFEYLARLEGVEAVPYRLAFDGTWHVDFASVEQALVQGAGRARAVVVVSPNNPTGSFLKRDELARLASLAERHDLALVSDEVFAPYGFGADPNRVTALAAEASLDTAAPAFSLGGLSKACGLPQLKCGWILVGGREPERSLAGLELVADTYLSVGTPVQAALPELLALGGDIRAAIAERVQTNLVALAAALPAGSSTTLLPAEGGWSAILRVPATHSDEAWAATLLDQAGVLVHPGYFFDLAGGTFLVVSLLPAPEPFSEAMRRLVAVVDGTPLKDPGR
jgi:aspartate/methionine/tyrosine aminotransferase